MIEVLIRLLVHLFNEAPYVFFLCGYLVLGASLMSKGAADPAGSEADECQEDADPQQFETKRRLDVRSALYATAPLWLSAPVGYILGSIGGQIYGWLILALFLIPTVGSCGVFKACGNSSTSFLTAVLYYPFGWIATLAIGYLGGTATL